jgi:hypothetical protein
MDPPLPVREGRDADAELSAEFRDGEVRFASPSDLPAPPVEPRLVVRPQSCPRHGHSPGTASHAVRGPGYHARQGWFGRTVTLPLHPGADLGQANARAGASRAGSWW